MGKTLRMVYRPLSNGTGEPELTKNRGNYNEALNLLWILKGMSAAHVQNGSNKRGLRSLLKLS
jgi:hypothetical protein